MRAAVKRNPMGSTLRTGSDGLGREDNFAETQKLRGYDDGMLSSIPSSNGPSRTDSFNLSAEDVVDHDVTVRKLNWHIMARFCLLTLLNHMDRANLAFAAPQMNRVLGFTDDVYGFGSGVFFVGYMIFQIPSQLAAQRIGAARWIAFLLVTWGIIATAFAGMSSSHVHLYTLRFLLGAAEAGTFPAMWEHLTHFYAGGPELGAAWGFIGAAQPLAQVFGAPIAAGLLSTDGFLGLRGYQWLFVVEGVPTILLGFWIWCTLAETPAKAKFLAPIEREHIGKHVKQHNDNMKKEAGDQHWTFGLTCWKVWAQGLGSGWAGILRYGAMYWTPLIVYNIVYGNDSSETDDSAAKSAMAAVLSAIPFSWAAGSTLINSYLAKKRGRMYEHCLVPLSIGSLALLILAFSLGHIPWLAFVGLMASATSQASNPMEWAYPATYLHGPAMTVGWTVANCVSAYGGLVGPWMIGAIKKAYGTYFTPMIILAVVNTCAVAYFAVLLRYLPANRDADTQHAGSPEDNDVEALVDPSQPRSDRH